MICELVRAVLSLNVDMNGLDVPFCMIEYSYVLADTKDHCNKSESVLDSAMRPAF